MVKRNLDKAIPAANLGRPVEVRWTPYLLRRPMSDELKGIMAFKSASITGQDAAAKQHQERARETRRRAWTAKMRTVMQAGEEVGIKFDFAKLRRHSNSIKAHMLLDYAWKEGGAQAQGLVAEALFVSHFEQGKDISSDKELIKIASGCGLDSGDRLASFLDSTGKPRLLFFPASLVPHMAFFLFLLQWRLLPLNGMQPMPSVSSTKTKP